MSVITAIIDLGSVFVLLIAGIFILTFCPTVGFWKLRSFSLPAPQVLPWQPLETLSLFEIC